MTYGFRLRFFLYGRALQSDELEEELRLPDGVRVRFAPTAKGAKLSESQDLILRASGFETRDAAETCGLRLRSALLTSMAELQLGLDTGQGVATLEFSDALRESHRKLGCQLLDNVHGLMVFADEPQPRFLVATMSFRVATPSQRIFDEWSRQYQLARKLTDKEALACEMYALARSEPSVRTQFLTMTTVVEVLAAGEMRSENAQKLIDEFIDEISLRVKTAELDRAELDSLRGGLRELKRGSIGSACRRYINARLGEAPAKEFIRLYKIRSTLVHAGRYDGSDLGDELTRLNALVVDLLALLGR